MGHNTQTNKLTNVYSEAFVAIAISSGEIQASVDYSKKTLALLLFIQDIDERKVQKGFSCYCCWACCRGGWKAPCWHCHSVNQISQFLERGLYWQRAMSVRSTAWQSITCTKIYQVLMGVVIYHITILPLGKDWSGGLPWPVSCIQ